MNRTDRVLNLMKDGEKWQKPQIAAALGCTNTEAHSALTVLRNALAILPSKRTNGYSDYTITAIGLERLAKKPRKPRTAPEPEKSSPTTQCFAIANRYVLQTVWGAQA